MLQWFEGGRPTLLVLASLAILSCSGGQNVDASSEGEGEIAVPETPETTYTDAGLPIVDGWIHWVLEPAPELQPLDLSEFASADWPLREFPAERVEPVVYQGGLQWPTDDRLGDSLVLYEAPTVDGEGVYAVIVDLVEDVDSTDLSAVWSTGRPRLVEQRAGVVTEVVVFELADERDFDVSQAPDSDIARDFALVVERDQLIRVGFVSEWFEFHTAVNAAFDDPYWDVVIQCWEGMRTQTGWHELDNEVEEDPEVCIEDLEHHWVGTLDDGTSTVWRASGDPNDPDSDLRYLLHSPIDGEIESFWEQPMIRRAANLLAGQMAAPGASDFVTTALGAGVAGRLGSDPPEREELQAHFLETLRETFCSVEPALDGFRGASSLSRSWDLEGSTYLRLLSCDDDVVARMAHWTESSPSMDGPVHASWLGNDAVWVGGSEAHVVCRAEGCAHEEVDEGLASFDRLTNPAGTHRVIGVTYFDGELHVMTLPPYWDIQAGDDLCRSVFYYPRFTESWTFPSAPADRELEHPPYEVHESTFAGLPLDGDDLYDDYCERDLGWEDVPGVVGWLDDEFVLYAAQDQFFSLHLPSSTHERIAPESIPERLRAMAGLTADRRFRFFAHDDTASLWRADLETGTFRRVPAWHALVDQERRIRSFARSQQVSTMVVPNDEGTAIVFVREGSPVGLYAFDLGTD